MALWIHGLETAQPPCAIAQGDAAKSAQDYCAVTAAQRRALGSLYRKTHIDHRGSVLLHSNGHGHAGTSPALGSDFFSLPRTDGDRGPTVSERMRAYAEHALPLAGEACAKALAAAGIPPHSVGQLVVVSCTGFFAPGLDVSLIESLGMDRSIGRTTIGFMGCHGAMNGLRVASALAAANAQPVLLCAVELCSLHFQYGWHPQRIVANALFADGAAAIVGEDRDKSRRFIGKPSGSDAAEGSWVLRANGSFLIADSHDDMSWHITEHGFVMTLSARVPDLIEEQVRPLVNHWLGEHGLKIEDIGSWAIHPGGPRIVDAVERGLALPSGAGDCSRDILKSCGNMSSPTILFILKRLMQAHAACPCVALAFGPGLMVEMALFDAPAPVPLHGDR